MSYHMRFFDLSPKPLTFAAIETALRVTDPGYRLDANGAVASLWLSEKALGEMEIHAPGDGAFERVVGERVAALVGLHVLAKRYLVTTDPDYRARLSPISVASLAAQGGDLSASEVRAFEARDHWREALMLRRADEAAKVAGRKVPGLDSWLPALARVAARA